MDFYSLNYSSCEMLYVFNGQKKGLQTKSSAANPAIHSQRTIIGEGI
jgi:hypothetical protein